jgi:hypothetical protein
MYSTTWHGPLNSPTEDKETPRSPKTPAVTVAGGKPAGAAPGIQKIPDGYDSSLSGL